MLGTLGSRILQVFSIAAPESRLLQHILMALALKTSCQKTVLTTLFRAAVKATKK
jgi:hypothetical protein